MTQVLDWQNAAEPRKLVCQAVEMLGRGCVVAFPTETTYAAAASALHPEAIQRLGAFSNRPLTLAMRGEADVRDWVPGISAVGRRLARRCWPGPVTLVFDGVGDGLVSRLTDTARRHICPTGAVRVRSPAHRAIQLVLHSLAAPLAFSGAHRAGAAPALTAAQVAGESSDAIDCVLDDGPSRYGQPSTVVQVNGADWRIVRPGVMSESLLRRQTAFLVVFVCTGNTCRSPLAESLCKKLLAERLGCTPAGLDERGFLVISAGLAAMMGGGPAAEAVEAARELGADLSGHRSRPFTSDLGTQADCIVAMTQGHLLAVAQHHPQLLERCRLLRSDGADIADPIGAAQEVYRQCAVEILGQLQPLVSAWANT
jgi:protein-tyrosine phosphatase